MKNKIKKGTSSGILILVVFLAATMIVTSVAYAQESSRENSSIVSKIETAKERINQIKEQSTAKINEIRGTIEEIHNKTRDIIKNRLAESEKVRFKDSEIQCRINFTKTVLDIYAPYYNGTGSVNKTMEILTSDYADLVNTTTIREQAKLRSQIQGNLEDANKIIGDARQAMRKLNVTNDTIVSLRSRYNVSKDAFVSCRQDRAVFIAADEADDDKGDLDTLDKTLSNLTARGYDVSNLTMIIQKKQKSLDDLQRITATGNGSVIQEAVRNASIQSHKIWASFELERLKLIMARVSPVAEQYNKTAQIQSITTLLDSVARRVSVDYQYQSDDAEQIRNDLQTAASQIRDLWKSLI